MQKKNKVLYVDKVIQFVGSNIVYDDAKLKFCSVPVFWDKIFGNTDTEVIFNFCVLVPSFQKNFIDRQGVTMITKESNFLGMK